MSPFAKLFESQEIGQVLVTLHPRGETGPEIRFQFDTGFDELGIATATVHYRNAGRELAQRVFDLMTADTAIEIARVALLNIRDEMAGEVAE